MKSRRFLKALCCMLVVLLTLSACVSAETVTAATEETITYTPGTYMASANGFGGEVTVVTTFDEDGIVEITIEGDNETQGVGSRAIEELPSTILAAQSADIDVFTGATVTSTAIKTALSHCFAEASGESEGAMEIVLKPGTYSGKGYGNFRVNPLIVSVTVDESKIVDVTLDDSADEDYGMVQSVEKNLLPRIVEYNSVGIDGITGATATSNAVKLAAREALNKALSESGYPEIDALEVFGTPVPRSNKQVEIDADVLIVGLGGSGITALTSAAEANADGKLKVLAIEKAGLFGGTTQLTGDVFALNPKSHKEKNNGGKDYQDPEEMRNDWLEYTTGKNGEQKAKVEMVDLLFEESGNMIDWLIDDYDFVFDGPMGGFTEADHYVTKFERPEATYRMGNSLGYQRMIDRAEQQYGAEIMYETEAYELITDDNGAVVGVKAHSLTDGTEYVIHTRAVITATGGFAGNAEMMEQYIDSEFFPFSGGWGLCCSTQNDGKMISEALRIGAATYNINMPPEWHNASSPIQPTKFPIEIPTDPEDQHNWFLPQAYSLNDLPTILGSSGNVLQVNKLGKRFDAETVKFRGPEGGNIFYGIQSKDSLDSIRDNGLTSQRMAFFVGIGGWHLNQPIPELYDVVDNAIELGICYKGDTLEELAAQIGMPEGELTATVARYNELCEKGEDEDYGKAPEYLEAVAETGPYYAFAVQEYIYNTLGGLDVDIKLRVLDKEGNPIPGLYSVGNDSIGVLFSNEKIYPTYGGVDCSWCYTSGKLAGSGAVASLLESDS